MFEFALSQSFAKEFEQGPDPCSKFAKGLVQGEGYLDGSGIGDGLVNLLPGGTVPSPQGEYNSSGSYGFGCATALGYLDGRGHGEGDSDGGEYRSGGGKG